MTKKIELTVEMCSNLGNGYCPFYQLYDDDYQYCMWNGCGKELPHDIEYGEFPDWCPLDEETE